jgi:hypothetical protein
MVMRLAAPKLDRSRLGDHSTSRGRISSSPERKLD